MKTIITSLLVCTLLFSIPSAGSAQQKVQQGRPQLGTGRPGVSRTTALLADEVRHQLVMLPYYGVFDWLEGVVQPNGDVVLRGQVVTPTLKSDAEKRVKSLESVSRVTNEIEVLPVSQSDDRVRREIYRAIFRFDGSLFQYATMAVPPVHIIVKGGHATLKGVVLNKMDRQLAETAARGVPDVFDVKNDLAIETVTSK